MKKIVAFTFILLIILAVRANATDYYIDPVSGNDSDNGLSQKRAWATFAYATTQLSAGDTLYLMDGTFNEFLDIGISGTARNPITFKALNDGQVTIDGQNKRQVVDVRGTSSNHVKYINLEGFIVQNANGVARSANGICLDISCADYINVRRVSCYGDRHGGIVVQNGSSNVLIEDCVARCGSAYPFQAASDTTYITFRRCYVRWLNEPTDSGAGFTAGINLYPANYSIVENCVITIDPTAKQSVLAGIALSNSFSNTGLNGNSFYGNVVIDFKDGEGFLINNSYCSNITGNNHTDCVAIRCKRGLRQNADDNWIGKNLTFVGTGTTNKIAGMVCEPHGCSFNSSFRCNGIFKNSSILTASRGIDFDTSTGNVDFWNNNGINIYNATRPYYDDATAGTDDTAINPNYDTATYGDGAYLMVPKALQGQGERGADIGAEVIYQYENGVLQDGRNGRSKKKLWPWPMENRIFAEIGVSVTWEANGGIWKTLDRVYIKNRKRR